MDCVAFGPCAWRLFHEHFPTPLCVAACEATAQAEPLHMRVERNQVSVPVYARTGHCSPPKSAHATKNFLSRAKSTKTEQRNASVSTNSKRARASRGPSPLTIITAVQFRMTAVPLASSSKLSSSSRLPWRALCMPPRAQAPRRQHLQPLDRLLVRAGFIYTML